MTPELRREILAAVFARQLARMGQGEYQRTMTRRKRERTGRPRGRAARRRRCDA